MQTPTRGGGSVLAALKDHAVKGSARKAALRMKLEELGEEEKAAVGKSPEGLHSVFKSLKTELHGKPSTLWDLQLVKGLLALLPNDGRYGHNIFRNFVSEDGSTITNVVFCAFKALSEHVVDTLKSSERKLSSLERQLYLDLLAAVQDILYAHDMTAGAFIDEWGCLLPELLDAVLCEYMPAVCRRELTITVGIVVSPRGNTLTNNVIKMKNHLMSDDFKTTNASILADKRYAKMPTSLAAFSGVFDTCGDFATQSNILQILHAAAKVGGLNPTLAGKAFGDVSKEFEALVENVDELHENFMEKINAFVTDYNISRGSKARVRCILAKRITIGGVVCDTIPWVHFNGLNAISVSWRFPGSSDPTPVDFDYQGCIRCASMPTATSIAFGVSAKPQGFGVNDKCDMRDDQWVVMEFGQQKFAAVQEVLIRASHSHDALKAIAGNMRPANQPAASKESRGVPVGDAMQQPMYLGPRLNIARSGHPSAGCPHLQQPKPSQTFEGDKMVVGLITPGHLKCTNKMETAKDTIDDVVSSDEPLPANLPAKRLFASPLTLSDADDIKPSKPTLEPSKASAGAPAAAQTSDQVPSPKSPARPLPPTDDADTNANVKLPDTEPMMPVRNNTRNRCEKALASLSDDQAEMEPLQLTAAGAKVMNSDEPAYPTSMPKSKSAPTPEPNPKPKQSDDEQKDAIAPSQSGGRRRTRASTRLATETRTPCKPIEQLPEMEATPPRPGNLKKCERCRRGRKALHYCLKMGHIKSTSALGKGDKHKTEGENNPKSAAKALSKGATFATIKDIAAPVEVDKSVAAAKRPDTRCGNRMAVKKPPAACNNFDSANNVASDDVDGDSPPMTQPANMDYDSFVHQNAIARREKSPKPAVEDASGVVWWSSPKPKSHLKPGVRNIQKTSIRKQKGNKSLNVALTARIAPAAPTEDTVAPKQVKIAAEDVCTPDERLAAKTTITSKGLFKGKRRGEENMIDVDGGNRGVQDTAYKASYAAATTLLGARLGAGAAKRGPAHKQQQQARRRRQREDTDTEADMEEEGMPASKMQKAESSGLEARVKTLKMPKVVPPPPLKEATFCFAGGDSVMDDGDIDSFHHLPNASLSGSDDNAPKHPVPGEGMIQEGGASVHQTKLLSEGKASDDVAAAVVSGTAARKEAEGLADIEAIAATMSETDRPGILKMAQIASSEREKARLLAIVDAIDRKRRRTDEERYAEILQQRDDLQKKVIEMQRQADLKEATEQALYQPPHFPSPTADLPPSPLLNRHTGTKHAFAGEDVSRASVPRLKKGMNNQRREKTRKQGGRQQVANEHKTRITGRAHRSAAVTAVPATCIDDGTGVSEEYMDRTAAAGDYMDAECDDSSFLQMTPSEINADQEEDTEDAELLECLSPSIRACTAADKHKFHAASRVGKMPAANANADDGGIAGGVKELQDLDGLMGAMHAIRKKKAEEAEAKIAVIMKELRNESERAVKALAAEAEKERAQLERAYRAHAESAQSNYDKLHAEAAAAHQRFRESMKERARAFDATKADEERKREELEKAVAASKEEVVRRGRDTKSRIAQKASRAAIKVKTLRQEAANGSGLRSMLLTLAEQMA